MLVLGVYTRLYQLTKYRTITTRPEIRIPGFIVYLTRPPYSKQVFHPGHQNVTRNYTLNSHADRIFLVLECIFDMV